MKGDKTVTFEIPPELYQAIHDEKNERTKAQPHRTAFFRDVLLDAIMAGLPALKKAREKAASPS